MIVSDYRQAQWQGQRNEGDSIRVLIVHDHAIVREGIRALLERESDLQVVGSAGSGEEATRFVAGTKADVVIVDVTPPGISGIETTRRLRAENPSVNVLALTMHTEDEYLLGVLDAGATGYLSRESMATNLLEAIRAVASGQYFLCPSATRSLIESLRRYRERPSPGEMLTSREKDILEFIKGGYTSREIGDKLRLSAKTIENYRARILGKLHVRNCSEAISKAIKQHIIEPTS